MENEIVLEKDTFIVRDENTYIVYTPFRSLITRVSNSPIKNINLYKKLLQEEFFQEVPKIIKPKLQWNGFQSLTLLLTRSCNMKCIYCYAKATPNGKSMPLNIALRSTDWFLKQLNLSRIRITFHGGGEPALEFKTIKNVVEYVENKKGNRKTTYLITTNGTAKKEVWDWMMNKKFGVSISMDGPPEIQDRNRPLIIKEQKSSSQIVEKNIQYLVSHDYPFSIRLTFSPTDDIERIIKYLGKLEVKKLHLEPLFPYGRDYNKIEFGKKTAKTIYAPQSSEFLFNFFKAIKIAKEFDIQIQNGHISNFINGIGYFCGSASAKSMVVNHEGKLTGCLEVVDSNDPDAKIFNFGYYVTKKKRFEIDFNKVKIMQKRHSDLLLKCKTCFARYTCAGGCAVKAVRKSGDFFGRDISYCVFTKKFIPILIKMIAKQTGI